MLASLTAKAVRRGWPPAVYARLVSQLNDGAETGDSAAVLAVFDSLMADAPPNPMLLEYVATLSNDVHALLPFQTLVARFAAEPADRRPPTSRDLMAYLARGGMAKWNLGALAEDEGLQRDLAALLDQALTGNPEARLFMLAITKQIGGPVPAPLRAKLAALGAASPLSPLRAAASDEGDAPESVQHASSRSARLLWLDWLLRTAQHLEYAGALKPQIDLLWPGDRVSVTTYELCVTAFDVVAAQLAGGPGGSPVVLARPFITHRLPLVLRDMAQGESLDGVIARILTTLDKSVVEAVEAGHPGLRARFGMACSDLGLCDPSVLHVLHRSHTPQPPPREMPAAAALLAPDYAWAQFAGLDPVSQAHVAGAFVEVVRGTGRAPGAITRHALAQHCAQLYNDPALMDSLVVHISVRDLVESVSAHADAASRLPEEDGGSGLVYSDLGVMLAALQAWSGRYRCDLPASSWSRRFIGRQMFGNVVDLSPEQTELMGAWVVGLFSGSGSGIADELLKPFVELADVLPVLLQQAVRAYRSAVIDRETFKNGLDYFLQQFSVTLFTPLALRVFDNDLLEGLHPSTSLECIIFFLAKLAPKRGPEFTMAKKIIAPRLIKQLQAIPDPPADTTTNAGLNKPPSQTPINSIINTNNSSIRKLTDELVPLIKDILKQIGCDEPAKPTPPTSFAETVTSRTALLMNWQLKPQGVPCVPGFLISTQVKPALGVEKTRALVQKVTLNKTQSSLETYWALLFADGLWQGPPLMPAQPTATGKEMVAREMLDKFLAVLRRIAADGKRPPVVIGSTDSDARQTSPGAADPPPVPPAEPVVDKELENGAPTGMDNGDVVMTMNAEEHSTNMEGGDGLGNGTGNGSAGPTQDNMTMTAEGNMNFGSQFDYGFDNKQDFDGDFSKPMNLADLDSAMDFAWD